MIPWKATPFFLFCLLFALEISAGPGNDNQANPSPKSQPSTHPSAALSSAPKSCQENYTPSGIFMGCTIKEADKVLNSLWVSPTFNVHGQTIQQGISWFRVDKNGEYEGHSIIRSSGNNCFKYDKEGWLGQVYYVAKNTYAAWNHDELRGFYLINISNDSMTGSSIMMPSPQLTNDFEKNEFFRKPLNYDLATLIRIANQFTCQP